MTDFEALGAFYLGKRYDIPTRTRRDDYVLYDAKDLTTHAVIIGMTGSGKTGLGVGLIEEALIDKVPVIAVETEGAASYAAALAAGAPVTLPAITSIATSLGARRVMPHVLDLAREHEIVSLTVSDRQAVQACTRFADTARVLVEPACGASIAALDAHVEAAHVRQLHVQQHHVGA